MVKTQPGSGLDRAKKKPGCSRNSRKKVGRKHQGMDRPGGCQTIEGSGEQGKVEENGCEVSCGAPTTVAVMG